MREELGIQQATPLSIYAEVPRLAESPGIPLCPMLHPFLGMPQTEINDTDPRRYEAYYASARKLFTVTDRGQARVAVLPWDWTFVRRRRARVGAARRYCRENRDAGLRTLVFFCDDSEETIRLPGALLFRVCMLGRRRQPHEYTLPAWSADFLKQLNRPLSLRPYSPKPVVGFCGASYRSAFKAPNWFRRNLRPARCQYERVYPRGQGLRAWVLDCLAGAREVEANIIERPGFLGGALANDTLDYDLFVRMRQEYIHNLLNSDYVLCVRGAGNASYRLYEALSLGRIPVLVNTDCVMPWEQLIHWRDLCIWVELGEVENIGNIVAEAHRRTTPEAFRLKQLACREVWENYLSPLGFFATLRAWLANAARISSSSRSRAASVDT